MKLTILKIVELLEFRGFESHLFLFTLEDTVVVDLLENNIQNSD